MGSRKTTKSRARKAKAIKQPRGASNVPRRRRPKIVSKTERAKYIRERDEAQERQAATAEVLKIVSRSAFDLQTVLDTLTKRAVQLCAADGGIISMQDGDQYRVRAVYGFSAEGKRYLLQHPLLPRNRGGVTGRVALSGKAVHIPDVLADAEYTATSYQRVLRQRTNLGLPLLRDGAAIGVFSLTRTKVAPFTDKQIELVTTFADQAVIAIENTRLLNELNEKGQQLRKAYEEAVKQQTAASEMMRIVSNSPVQSVLDAVAENAAHLCDADNARIWRLDDDNRLRMAAAYGQNLAPGYGREGLPVDRDTVIGRAAGERRTIHVHDLAAEDGEYPVGSRHVQDEGYRTTLATPLLRQGAPIGVILVRRVEIRPFDARQIALVENFADQAAIAIENVRLFEAEKQQTQALAQSEYKLRQIIETVPAFLWSAAPGGEPTHINQRILDYSGMRLENFQHNGWEAFTHPADFPETAKAFYHAIQTGTSYDAVHRLRRAADGEYRWYHARGEPLRDRQGNIIQWYGLSVDIDERKHAEEALRESEMRFRDFAETASDWLWETGPDYKFTSLTENAFGSDSTGRLGKACWEYALDLETEPEKWQRIRATMDARQPFRDFVYCSSGGNGSPMFVRASGRPVFDDDGQFRGYRGTGTDVTAVVRAQRAEESLRTVQAELAHVSRITTLGQLTASIAHEITQPIATARNNARAALNFLDRQPPEMAEIREALSCILGDTDRAGKIIDRIRDQIKKAPPQKERFDLIEAMNEVIMLAGSAIAESGVSVRANIPKEPLPILGDRVQLQQVILNLILNAVEAMGSVRDGPRDLATELEQTGAKGILVAVYDSGPGIDPKDRERIFQAFYSTKSSGVGIGLAICRSIIEAHGGRLWAEGNKPRGAVFKFTLPNAENS